MISMVKDGADLERRRAKLAELFGLPVFTVSERAIFVQVDCAFRFPGTSEYTPKISVLRCFLDGLTDDGLCVGKTSDGRRQFDLRESDYVRLAMALPDGKISTKELFEKYGPHFYGLGLVPDLNIQRVRADSDVPGLSVRQMKLRTGYSEPSVYFLTSLSIMRPRTVAKNWTLETSPGMPKGFVGSLTAPGARNGKPICRFEPWNAIGVVEREPGGCQVCYGESGERRHLAYGNPTPSIVFEPFICVSCFPKAAEEWMKLAKAEQR